MTNPSPNLPRLIPPRDAARTLGVHPRSLQKWRAEGRGPRWTRIEGRIRYYADDLREYIDREAASIEGGQQ